MAKKKTVTGGIDEPYDDFLNELYEQLNKQGMPIYRIGEEAAPSDLSDFVSSGSSTLDLGVSNRPNGGIIAYGRMLQLEGMEQSGKSLVCAHMIADVQKDGGIAVLIDSEYAINEDYFRAVGVDFSKLQVIHSVNLEEVFGAIENIIMAIRKKNKDRKVIIIIDSLTALKPAADLESDVKTKEGYGTQKAIFLSNNLPKINSLIANQKIALVYTQQLRHRMNAMPFGDQYTTSGGRAPGFYASVRIRFSKKGDIKIERFGEKVVVGVNVIAQVTKNRLGPPLRKIEFDVYFDRGIDDVSSWITELTKRNIITGNAKKYTFVDTDTGEEYSFTKGTWKTFTQDNPEVFTKIYEQLAESMVMVYKSDDVSTTDGSALIEDGENFGD